LLIEEFVGVRRTASQGQRLIDAVIVLGEKKRRLTRGAEIDLAGRVRMRMRPNARGCGRWQWQPARSTRSTSKRRSGRLRYSWLSRCRLMRSGG
jgi:hypothetical protein